MKISDLNPIYDELQLKYGAPELNSIYNGGCEKNPDVCFIFMNPTGRNIASFKSWQGRRSPWIATKNIWKLFYRLNLLEEEIFQEIQKRKPQEWDYEFADSVYNNIEKNKIFITNLGKCTQIDARPLPNAIYKEYLELLEKEIEIIKPKVIVTFGNQISSLFLHEKIEVSKCRRKEFVKIINKKEYKTYPIYYPVGNGMRNIDFSVEDIHDIMNQIRKED